MGGVLMAAAMGSNKLAVSLNPANATTGGTAGGHVQAMTALPSGGSGAYSYAWTVVQADADYPLTINSPAAATTTFDFTDVADGDIAQARVRCTVTDTGTGLTAFAEGLVTFVDQHGTGGSNGGGTIPGGIGKIP